MNSITKNCRALGTLVLTTAFFVGCAASSSRESQTVTISIVGTNDVHGQLLAVDGNRGLAIFAGYVNNLRAKRDADGGAVLLIDAGDMWQGTLESNLAEGQPMIAAYNAMGYNAAAVGNHEFDFGPVGDKAMPEEDGDDAQGALKQRATEASFPLLAANLIDKTTGLAVDWPNVQPSTMVEAAGINIGIIGVMSENALSATIAANVRNLEIAALAPTIASHARALRSAGADIVIVTAHAGSFCESFADPYDLSTCNLDGEIMRVARELPAGLVDQIIGGHVHRGIAHEINGIAITSSFSNVQAFGRVDYSVNSPTRAVTGRVIHPPHPICAFAASNPRRCVPADNPTATRMTYEDKPVAADAAVAAIANEAAARADTVKSEQLGVFLETPITLDDGTNSALGHLFMQAVLESTDGDIVIHNVMGGIRADLPAGELIYDSAYQIYPFDNRVTYLQLTGAELRRVVSNQAGRIGRRAGIAGFRIEISCENGTASTAMFLNNGSEISDSDSITVATTDFLALGGDNIFTPIIPDNGFALQTDTPLVRDVVVGWLRAKGGRLSAQQFLEVEQPRWDVRNEAECAR